MKPVEFGNAKWITLEQKTEADIRKGAGYLRKKFIVGEDSKEVLLHATAHGLYEIHINGRGITNARLTPGCDEYGSRLQYQTYPVSEYVSVGENEILVTLGDGWYRGCNGIDGVRNLFGEDLSFLCRIEEKSEGEEKGTTLAETDDSWEGSGKGPILLTDLELGEVYDARKEEIRDWHPARILEFGFDNLVPTETVPVTEHEVFEGKRMVTPDGEVVYDFGQNLAGYTRILIEDAKEGQELLLVHGETLDENGNFTIANFQPGERNQSGGIRQELRYFCKAGKNVYQPHFSMFGFRYARLVTDIPVEKIRIQSIAVYSDMKETASFTCSEESVNRLFQNSVWSMKSNFCEIPTDCPTRERAGWTGDAGVFVQTGTYLMDCEPVYRKWLANVRLNQHKDGKMAYISPKNGVPGQIAEMFSASVGWGDAGVIVPYTLYRMYGDRTVLEENYNMMKKWVDFLSRRAQERRQPDASQGNSQSNALQENPYQDYVIDTGMDYGEWCEPGANVMETMKQAFQFGQPEVATAYYSYSSKLLSEIAHILGREEDRKYYGELSEKARQAYRFLFVKDGHIVSERQCEYVRPLAFGLLEEDEAKMAAKDLNALVIKNNYHLNTGFLSTPFLCEVLAEYGYVETAYRLLLQKNYPGWLYAVEKGATTIWETWDGIREDGSVHDSLNHYSYGAVSGWLLSGICGIRFTKDTLQLSPVVHPLMSYAKGSFDSPKGRIVSEWKYDRAAGEFHYHFEIPQNVSARIILQDGREEVVCGGAHDF